MTIMTRFLKKLFIPLEVFCLKLLTGFIPHERNNFRPHILRRRTALFFAVSVFVLEGMFLTVFFTIIPQSQFFSSILPTALIDLTNASREQNNIPTLKENALLVLAAQKKAADMAQKGYFSHVTPDGKDPWYWLGQAGYKYDFAGENLAVNFSDSKDVAQAWMASPTHRANILANYFNEIGIASAKGIYQGKEAIFVVQFFGRPATKVALSFDKPVPTRQEIEKVPGAIDQKVPNAISKPEPPEIKQPLPASPATTTIAQEKSLPPQQVVAGQSAASSQTAAKTDLPFWQKAASMPRGSLNVIYAILAATILLALVLKIFVKIRVQHPPLIFNGTVLLFILVSFLYINHLLSQIGIVF